jgi:hypothetical protein
MKMSDIDEMIPSFSSQPFRIQISFPTIADDRVSVKMSNNDNSDDTIAFISLGGEPDMFVTASALSFQLGRCADSFH